MRFNLVSQTSILLLGLVLLAAPIIAEPRQANGGATHLDPRAGLLGPVALVKKDDGPAGPPSLLMTKAELFSPDGASAFTRDVPHWDCDYCVCSGPPPHDSCCGYCLALNARNGNGEESKRANDQDKQSRDKLPLTTKLDDVVQRNQEIQDALVTARVATIKSSRFFDNAKECSDRRELGLRGMLEAVQQQDLAGDAMVAREPTTPAKVHLTPRDKPHDPCDSCYRCNDPPPNNACCGTCQAIGHRAVAGENKKRVSALQAGAHILEAKAPPHDECVECHGCNGPPPAGGYEPCCANC